MVRRSTETSSPSRRRKTTSNQPSLSRGSSRRRVSAASGARTRLPPRPGLVAVVVGGHRLDPGPPLPVRDVPQGRGEDRRLGHEDVAHLGRGDPHLHRRHRQGEGQHAHGAGPSQGAHAEARRVGVAHRHVQLLGQLQVQVVPRLGDVLDVPGAQGRLHHEETALRLSPRPGEAQGPVSHHVLVPRLVPARHLHGGVVEDPVAVVEPQPEGDHRGLRRIGVGQAQQVQPRVVLPRDADHRDLGISVPVRLVVGVEPHRVLLHVGPAGQAHVQMVAALAGADPEGDAADFDAGTRRRQLPLGDPVAVAHLGADEAAVVEVGQIDGDEGLARAGDGSCCPEPEQGRRPVKRDACLPRGGPSRSAGGCPSRSRRCPVKRHACRPHGGTPRSAGVSWSRSRRGR